jgi:1,2-diacylglycerol 3-alpha-glucosyltransferase
MKILVLNSILFTPQKGVIPKVTTIKETMAYNLSLGFARAGHEVTLVAAADYRPLTDEEYPFEVLFMKSCLPCLFQPSVLPLHLSLWRYLRRFGSEFDLIVSSELFSFNSLFAALTAGRRTVVWQELGQHNRKMHELPSRLWYNVVVRCLMRRVTVVARSWRAAEFVKRFGVRVSSDVIDNCIDTRALRPCSEKRRQMIVVARLVAEKGIDYAIRRFADFVRRDGYSDFRLYIVGEGEARSSLTELISRLGVERSVVMTGALSHAELSDYLSHSMAMLFSSRRELNAIVLSESLYSATPVVTNSVPYSSDLISRERLGIVSDEWDESDLRRIVDENEEYVERCMAHSRQMTLDATVERFIKIGERL